MEYVKGKLVQKVLLAGKGHGLPPGLSPQCCAEIEERIPEINALVKACEELIKFCESRERYNQDDVCPVKAYELAKAAVAEAIPNS